MLVDNHHGSNTTGKSCKLIHIISVLMCLIINGNGILSGSIYPNEQFGCDTCKTKDKGDCESKNCSHDITF